MKFSVTQKFLIGKVEDKGNVNLYTLLDTDFNKLVAVGVKEDIGERSLVEVELVITTNSEKFELKNGQFKFVNAANLFIKSLKVVKDVM
jgi:hypothetical protein